MISLEESNNKIINLIKSDTPFLITKLGYNTEGYLVHNYIKNKIIDGNYVSDLSRNTGIYNLSSDNIKEYCNMYNDSIVNTDLFGTYKLLLNDIQNYFITENNLISIDSNILEPYYCNINNIVPWTHYLVNKKVLIIHPFIDSIKIQLSNNFTFFKEQPIFMEEQQFEFYKTYQTNGGNFIHSNWKETLEIMCKEISKINFDIALVACGGYSLLICNYIKTELNKSSIYMGGTLQLLFGVIGNRWINDPFIKSLINENNSKFIRPNKNEQINNYEIIENGCYW